MISEVTWPSSGNFGTVEPAPFTPQAMIQLRDVLSEKADLYATEAALLAGIHRIFATDTLPDMKSIRKQLETVRDGGDIEAAAAPHLKAALLVDMGISNPYAANREQISKAAALALDELPIPHRGRPRKPAIPGRDWLEESLLALFSRVSGRRATSVEAADCACIVMAEIGILGATEAESRQRADRRRRNR